MSWWASIEKPRATGGSQRFLVELGDEPDDPTLAALRTEYGIPADWMERRLLDEPWQFMVSPGEPHPERMWSVADLRAARERLEDAVGIPAQLQQIRALENQLETAAQYMPMAALLPMLDQLKKIKHDTRQVSIDEVREAMAGVPPTRATVKRKPPKSGG